MRNMIHIAHHLRQHRICHNTKTLLYDCLFQSIGTQAACLGFLIVENVTPQDSIVKVNIIVCICYACFAITFFFEMSFGLIRLQDDISNCRFYRWRRWKSKCLLQWSSMISVVFPCLHAHAIWTKIIPLVRTVARIITTTMSRGANQTTRTWCKFSIVIVLLKISLACWWFHVDTCSIFVIIILSSLGCGWFHVTACVVVVIIIVIVGRNIDFIAC